MHKTQGFLTIIMLVGCGEGAGDVAIFVEAEDTIVNGIAAGDAAEDIRDGWTINFDHYISVIGAVRIAHATDPSITLEDPRTVALDLTAVGESGVPLTTLEGATSGRWEFHYRTDRASAETERDASVEVGRFDEMVEQAWTYSVEGTLTHPSGQSCPPTSIGADLRAGATPNGTTNSGGNVCFDNPVVSFRIGADASTGFGPCQIDEVPGFAVTAGSVSSVAITIHGDHLFFNGFPEGDEGGITRLAQWLADCDLDLSGTITLAELEAIAPSDLPEIDDRFQLGGSPITPLDNMLDYLAAQLKTQGHFQGEGECAIDPIDR